MVCRVWELVRWVLSKWENCWGAGWGIVRILFIICSTSILNSSFWSSLKLPMDGKRLSRNALSALSSAVGIGALMNSINVSSILFRFLFFEGHSYFSGLLLVSSTKFAPFSMLQCRPRVAVPVVVRTSASHNSQLRSTEPLKRLRPACWLGRPSDRGPVNFVATGSYDPSALTDAVPYTTIYLEAALATPDRFSSDRNRTCASTLRCYFSFR